LRAKRDRRTSPLTVFLGLLGLIAAASAPLPLIQPAAQAATTFTVNSTGDGADSNTSDDVCNDGTGNCTLRAAIQQANTTGRDTINFSVTGTINLTSELPEISGHLVINGPGSSLLTVRRHTGGDYRILNIASSVIANISGLTLSNGRLRDGINGGDFGTGGGAGGGISNYGNLTLTDVRVTDNRTGNGGSGAVTGADGGSGGGIHNGHSLTMTDCVVSGNSTGTGGSGALSNGSGGDGAGVYNTGTLTMTNTVISGNTCGAAGTGVSGGSGGGVYQREGALTLNGVSVRDNKAGGGRADGGSAGSGGGGFFRAGVVTLTNSTVSDNAAGVSLSKEGGEGGGVFNQSALVVAASTVSGNTTQSVGGGIFNLGTVRLANSTVSGNQANTAGAVSNNNSGASSALTLTNCTVVDNHAAVRMGGVNNPRAAAAVANTVIARNTGGVVAEDTNGNFNSLGHNFVGAAGLGDAGQTWSNGPGDQVGTQAAPLDAKLGPLADNGGPTMTHAPLAGSPLLDAGDNSLARDANGGGLATDQRGAHRFAGPGVVSTVDIGAFELNKFMNHLFDMETNEDTPLTFAFFVGDQTVTSLTVTSGNTTLVPNANITLTGTGPVRTVRIVPAANLSGTSIITVNLNGSHEGAVSQTFQLTVRPVNDAPTFKKGADPVVAEDSGPQTYANWVTDVSPGPEESEQSVLLWVISNTNPALFSAGPAVSQSGTLTFTPAPNANGSATLTLELADSGSLANGGQASTVQTFKITVTPVNDAPVAQGQTVTTLEDSPNFITLVASDVDNNPLTYTVVSGPSHGTLTGTGSGRSYVPAANFNGADSFTFKVTDTAGADSATATVSINVTAVNDPPVNIVPNPQATDQNATLVFSAANSNAISVADLDAGSDPLRVTLTATRGTLTLGSTAGLTFVTGDGSDDVTMTFNGALGNVNAALNGLAFKPESRYAGSASLQISTSDQGSTGLGGARTDTDSVSITVRPGTIEFTRSAYTAAEGSGSLAVTVRRTGDTSQAASVAYATDDGSISSVSVPCSTTTGAALERCDFTKALGRLIFAPGESEKSFNVLLGDDSYVEGTETALLRLSGVGGAGVVLGSRLVATLEITDNTPESAANPIDDSGRFVRQHYHDFLGREPDASGLAFWTNEIEQCGADAGCREVKRINVSAAFFLSIEFQQTGYYVYRLDKVAFGNLPGSPMPLTLSEFLSDTQSIGRDVVVGDEGWQQLLESKKRTFASEFVTRPRFLTRYPAGLPPEQYVDELNANAGGVLSQEERDLLVAELKNNVKPRAAVLKAVAEHPALVRRESNQAFVLMQFFGYLRRDPDSAPDTDFSGYNFWLGKLNEFDGDFIRAEMVKAFISSDEYRKRFGQ
jgi:CSLREA domain-containing protein